MYRKSRDGKRGVRSESVCTLTDTVIWLKNTAIHNEQCDELIYSTANYYYRLSINEPHKTWTAG